MLSNREIVKRCLWYVVRDILDRPDDVNYLVEEILEIDPVYGRYPTSKDRTQVIAKIEQLMAQLEEDKNE